MPDTEIWVPASEVVKRQKAAAAVQESAWIQHFEEATYDPVFDFEFSTPYQQSERLGAPIMPVNTIREWTDQERRDVLIRCHLAWERNPIAKGAVRIIRSFVVARGLSVSYRNEDVKKIIEQFRFDNRRKIQQWERQWFDQLLVDGEVFVRIFTNDIGDEPAKGELSHVDVTTIKPWLVQNIESDEENRDNVIQYWIRPEKGTGGPFQQEPVDLGVAEEIPEAEIIHCKITALAYEKRGRSELFVVLPWVRAYQEWLQNRARINRYTGFLYQLKLTNATAGQVSAKRAQMRQPPSPGSVYVSSDAESLEELGGRIDAGRVAEDGRQLKLMSIISFPLPEFMLSEGENANLATARAQQMPALRTFETYQDIYTQELWRPVYEAVLMAAGLELDADVPEHDADGKATDKTIKVYEAFEVEAPSILDDDPKDLAEALTLHRQMGIASKQTVSTRASYDFNVEQELIAKEEKQEADEVMQGRRLGNIPVPAGAPARNGGPPAEEEDDDGT